MKRLTSLQLSSLIALGASGAALAHFLGYWAAHPVAHERAGVLAESGHGYWDTAVAVALVGLVLGLAGQVVTGLRGDRILPRGSVWLRLALTQTVVFTMVEVGERVLQGSHSQVWQEPAFWVALPIQLIVAYLGAFLFGSVQRAGAILGSSSPSAPLRPLASTLSHEIDLRISGPFQRSAGTRDPPSTSST